MTKLIRVLARIKLLPQGRQTAFVNGYRPLFDFKDAPTKISGRIDLIDVERFEPGSQGLVNIAFIKDMINDGYFSVGSNFAISEGGPVLGEGEIVEVMVPNL